MLKSYNTDDKLFKFSMTDEHKLRVDFLTKNIIKKNLPICLYLKKNVESSKHIDLINICVRILHDRNSEQMENSQWEK